MSTALQLLDRAEVQQRIAAFLPEGVSPERVAAAVSLALNDPKTGKALAACTPQSVVRAVGRIAQWGLEVGVTAYLVPFGRECVPVADYKGLIELVVASGAARDIDAHVVYEGDEFDYELGLDNRLVHRPRWSGDGKRKIVAAYAIARIKFGYTKQVVMTADEIDEIRQQYSKQWKSGPLPDWYAVKTCVRRLVKLLPQNPRLASAMAKIEDEQQVELGEGVDIPSTYTVQDRPALPAGDEDGFTDEGEGE